MGWKIEYYNEKVRAEIMGLPIKAFAKYEMIVARLEQFGPDIQRMPHMRYLQKGLWEIRAIASDGSARIFYCLCRNDVFLMLHSFLKKSQATPIKELNKALKRMKEVQNEQNE